MYGANRRIEKRDPHKTRKADESMDGKGKTKRCKTIAIIALLLTAASALAGEIRVRAVGNCMASTLYVDLNHENGESDPFLGYSYAVNISGIDIVDVSESTLWEEIDPDFNALVVRKDEPCISRVVLVDFKLKKSIPAKNGIQDFMIRYKALGGLIEIMPGACSPTEICFVTANESRTAHKVKQDNLLGIRQDCDKHEPIPGDVNFDGQLDIADVSSLLSYLHAGGKLYQPEAADFNHDGSINIADAVSMLGHLY